MTSIPADQNRAADFIETVVCLQSVIRNFREDIENGRSDFVLTPIVPTLESDSAPVTLKLTSANNEIQNQLKGMMEDLEILVNKLRERGQWKPSIQPANTVKPTFLDISDLSTAIDLLSYTISSTHPDRQLTPQPLLSAYSWTWDHTWHEFYTYIPEQNTYLYLSRWKFDEARGVWEHVSMANANLMPDTMAELLGSWEDWLWHPLWNQWCLLLQEEGVDEDGDVHIFPSRWQIQDDGDWVYVGW